MPLTVINYESPYGATDLRTFLADPVTQGICWKLTPAANSILSNSSLKRDLTAAWKFDDLADATERGNDFTNHNSATFVTGKLGNAVSFNGTNQYLTRASTADIQLGEIDWTIAFWVFPTQDGNFFFGKGTEFDFISTGACFPDFTVYDENGDPGCSFAYSTPFRKNQWNLVIAWRDVAAESCYLQVNGGAVQSGPWDSVGVPAAVFAADLIVAKNGPAYYPFRLDSLGIWKRQLTESERRELWNHGIGREYPFPFSIAATSHTRDLILPGHPELLFRSLGGIKSTAVDTEAGQESAGLNFLAVFDDDAITPLQLDEGDWDGARLDVYLINYKAPKMGQYVEFSGPIGGFSEEGIVFEAQARPLTALARIKVGRRASANCDVGTKGPADVYGGSRCKLDLTSQTHAGTVTSGASQHTFRASALPAGVLFTMVDGHITFLTGDNAGRRRTVRAWNNSNGEIIVQKAFPYTIDVGDTFTAVEGCDRTAAACTARDNIKNFRGLPFITNLEKFNQIIRA